MTGPPMVQGADPRSTPDCRPGAAGRSGGRAKVLVTVDGVPLDWRASMAVRNHSPTGPAWGYGGSGPAQLRWTLDADDVRRWLELAADPAPALNRLPVKPAPSPRRCPFRSRSRAARDPPGVVATPQRASPNLPFHLSRTCRFTSRGTAPRPSARDPLPEACWSFRNSMMNRPGSKPMASAISMNSRRSRRLSPFSYLATKDCGR